MLRVILLTALFVSCDSDKDVIHDIFEESKITIEINHCGGSTSNHFDDASSCEESQIVIQRDANKDGLATIRWSENDIDKKLEQEVVDEIRDVLIDCYDAYGDPVSNAVLIECEYSTFYLIKGEHGTFEVMDDFCNVLDKIILLIGEN